MTNVYECDPFGKLDDILEGEIKNWIDGKFVELNFGESTYAIAVKHVFLFMKDIEPDIPYYYIPRCNWFIKDRLIPRLDVAMLDAFTKNWFIAKSIDVFRRHCGINVEDIYKAHYNTFK